MASAQNSQPNRLKVPTSELHESAFYEFMIQNCQEDLKKILVSPNADDHFGLLINYVELNVSCSGICNELLRNPDKVLSAGDKAGGRALRYIYENFSDNRDLVLKRFVHVRIHSMPSCWNRYMTTFPGCKERGNFITIVGTVVRTKGAKLLEYRKGYRCSKCKQVTLVEAPASRFHAFPKSQDKCPNLCVGGKVVPCEDDTNIDKSCRLKDYQEIKLQEQSKLIDELPKALWVILENDLVNSCKPGDDVIVTGKLYLRWPPFRVNQILSPEYAFLANHIQVNNDQKAAVVFTDEIVRSYQEFWNQYENNPFEGRKLILKSFCPQVYGMYLVKLATFVVLAGGVSKSKSGSSIRGESHLLLVGDPGTGKSQMLKYVSQLIPRSLMTTGAGTTSAGLTVSAVKDGGEWHLEAGSLVLADGGVCCIDEFSHIKEHDRISIHEAMEQQSISVAKAGMVCSLSTKCTIIAACNPKLTKYDTAENLEINIGLASPLLSRFDLIIVLRDLENDSWDEYLCDYVLYNAMQPIDTKSKHLYDGLWDTDKLQSYLVLIKEKKPAMTDDALIILNKYYQLQRDSAYRNVARTTVRMFESLIRLAEGHARLMYRDCVLIHDAITAVSLMEASMQTSALASMPNSLHISFPEDPLQEYYNQAKLLLETLGLPKLWAVEKIYLENFMKTSKNVNPEPPPPPLTNNYLDRQQNVKSPLCVTETQSSQFASSVSQRQQQSVNIIPDSSSSQIPSSFRDGQIPSYNADEELFAPEVSEFFNDDDFINEPSTPEVNLIQPSTSRSPQPSTSRSPQPSTSGRSSEPSISKRSSEPSTSRKIQETISSNRIRLQDINFQESHVIEKEPNIRKRKASNVETDQSQSSTSSNESEQPKHTSLHEHTMSILSRFRREET
ncbi:unnamed protein product [Orchesella dallaii]|uniref:DNA helicase MCM9 n=1 Tax=Orchesella dallaii TaxID=48710 RepID=A0ABP1PNV8_9HEXA